MVVVLSHTAQYGHIKLRFYPWINIPDKAPRGSPEIPTHKPITVLDDSFQDCVLVTDGRTTGWVRREYIKIAQTHDRRGQDGHEKTKLRKYASREEDFVSPVVELTKGMIVALLDGSNGMSQVSAIVNGKVCTGWVRTSYLH
jgi:hypothetical protein